MITYAVCTLQYDIDLNGLLSRRLSQCGCVCGLAAEGVTGEEPAAGERRVTVTLREGESLLRFAEALAMLLCRDLPYFELAAYTDALPLTLPEKRGTLRDALREVRTCEEPAQILGGITAYLLEERRVNLEGYLRFRMRDAVERWREAADRAAAERLLRREYAELLGTLGAYLQAQRPKAGELALCLHPDGSCTLTDDSDARIEYLDCSEDGVLSLLVGMAPARLTVYDLSGGAADRLTGALRRVFAGRVRIYR